MNPFESLRLALTSLLSNKMRSVLTMLGVIIGVMSVILLVSIGQGVSSNISDQITGLGSNLVIVMPGGMGGEGGGGPSGFVNRLKYEHYEEIARSIPWIKQVVPYIEGSVRAVFRLKKQNAMVVASTPNYYKVSKFDIVKGRFFNDSQNSSMRKVCVIGWTLASKMFSNGNPIGRKLSLNGQRFTVIGQLEKKGNFMGMDQDNVVMIPITTATKLFSTELLTGIMIESPSSGDIPRLERKVQKVLSRYLEPSDFSVRTQGEILGMLDTILGTLTMMLGGIAGISLIVGGIGIMNIMLVSVTERTREIGIRKAVGAKRRDILAQFLIEAVVLSSLGGLIGIGLGAGGSLGLNKVLPSRVTLWSVAIAFAFAAVVGIVSGVYPAFKAAKMDPIDALRYE